MDWKDTLLPGATRTPWKPGEQPADTSGLGWVLDTYGVPTERNDWVMGPNGVPVISGSSEAQPGAAPGGGGAGPAAVTPPADVGPPVGQPAGGGDFGSVHTIPSPNYPGYPDGTPTPGVGVGGPMMPEDNGAGGQMLGVTPPPGPTPAGDPVTDLYLSLLRKKQQQTVPGFSAYS